MIEQEHPLRAMERKMRRWRTYDVPYGIVSANYRHYFQLLTSADWATMRRYEDGEIKVTLHEQGNQASLTFFEPILVRELENARRIYVQGIRQLLSNFSDTRLILVMTATIHNHLSVFCPVIFFINIIVFRLNVNS